MPGWWGVMPGEECPPLGMRLMLLRRMQDITQQDLAIMLGVHRTFISRVENGRRDLPLYLAVEWARMLGMPPDYLLQEIVSDTAERPVLVRGAAWEGLRVRRLGG